MLSKVSNFLNKLSCRTGLPKAIMFSRGSINVGVGENCFSEAYSMVAGIGIMLQSLSSPSDVSGVSISTAPGEDQLNQSRGSEEKSNGKSVANELILPFCSLLSLELLAVLY
jgi:hypothetical protein